MAAAEIILFDLGGVLLPFDRERRVRAMVEALPITADAARVFMASDLHHRLDVGRATEGEVAAALSVVAGKTVTPAETRALLLSVFEPPNMPLWDLVAALREEIPVGGFSDNPAFVASIFPDGAFLEPMIFSAEIGAAKPTDAAFAAAEARLGFGGESVLFIDDTPANVAAARRRGWDAILFTDNAALFAELGARGLP